MNKQIVAYLGSSLFVVFFAIWLLLFTHDIKATPAITCNVPSTPYSTIQSAVNDPTCSMINVNSGTFVENVSINRVVSIAGQGSLNTTVDGDHNGIVFTIQSGAVVTLTEMSIINGSANFCGGGIYNNAGTVILSHSTLSSNLATNNAGGGICNISGTITISNSILMGNSASGGGGIFNQQGTVTISNSTIRDNSARWGGGILTDYGTVTLHKSTLSGNSAITSGGGIEIGFGTLILNNSTLSDNSAYYSGGGIVNNYADTIILINSTLNGNSATSGYGGGIFIDRGGGATTLINSIVANSPSGGDCAGYIPPIISQGYNLDSDNTCNLTAMGDTPGVNPMLEPLQANGGDTWTHALMPGSPAVNHIPPGVNGCGTTIMTDQRGEERPSGSGCDMGAYEWVEPVLYLPLTHKP